MNWMIIILIRNNDENAFLGLQWNSIINQPQVYKFNLIVYLVIEFVFMHRFSDKL